ncbi:protein BIG GRAIN 1-like A [Olea europaea var. sylvestris]|uniref:protein BIG GRAIN 1-like A n=1 Tax=Olea europaea var. sylvestris TaxID=158386 RepID=UPI000C1CF8BB|nr:protein BIG GRAIN 1-like A [Olea europaea var. sylvestris]
MEGYAGYRKGREINSYSYSYSHSHSNSNPSFSSTLLDAIYRSIDEGEEELVSYKETMKKKQNDLVGFQSKEEMANFQRVCMIEKWMEKKVSEKAVDRRKSMVDFDRKSRKESGNIGNSLFLKSSSSSSDSSCGGGFSSSEAESVHVVSSRTSCYGLQRPKPIRTSVMASEKEKIGKYDKVFDDNTCHQKHKNEGGFMKTKSKALKIYGDLKKVKQPISPGGRLASFLNSLFTASNAKKSKISSNGAYDDHSSTVKSANASTCSSASSFSRSCLSKTPSSRGKSSNGTKRSVRFYPVSEIVDEDCQPCGHKSLHEDKQKLEPIKSRITSSINDELMVHLMEKNRRVEDAARDLLRNYQKKVETEFELERPHVKNQVFDNQDEDLEEDEDEDDASCASSELFELNNLSAIGMERYREGLPVYETTRLDKNRAIANGLIL